MVMRAGCCLSDIVCCSIMSGLVEIWAMSASGGDAGLGADVDERGARVCLGYLGGAKWRYFRGGIGDRSAHRMSLNGHF